MSATSSAKRRIKYSALGLMTLALAFYFGFIAMLVFVPIIDEPAPRQP